MSMKKRSNKELQIEEKKERKLRTRNDTFEIGQLMVRTYLDRLHNTPKRK